MAVTKVSGVDMNGLELILDANSNTSITADTDDQIDIKIAGADDFQFTANTFTVLSGSTLAIASGATIANSGTATGFSSADPSSADGDSLGTASAEWSDLYLADGGVIYFGNDQDVTLTHNADTSLTCNLMIAATTFEPTGDTASGDNAAIGYTAGEGLILTGQGSTSDITVKNDADGTVFTVPTGTDDILFPDSAKAMWGAGSDMLLYHDGSNSYITNAVGALKIATETSGIAVTIGHGTSEVTVADNLVVTGTATAGGNLLSQVGTQTIWVPAIAMRPTVSNGCASITNVETTSGRPDMQVLDFDDASDEHAQFQIGFPKSWNEGTITFRAFWTSTATDTDGVAWGLQGVSVANDGTIDVAYGTAVVVTDDNISAAEDCLVTATSSAVTIASAAVNTLTYFRIFRDVSDGNDDMAEDARLLGVQIFYTTDAVNDA